MYPFYKGLIICYLIGSIPFSVFLSKLFFSQDIREMGSGNIGASNAYRLGGPFFAFFIALLDIFKGFMAVYIGPEFGLDQNMAMLFVCFGNMFSPFLKFSGGKGVATYTGALLAIDFNHAWIVPISWMLLTRVFKLPFLSSILVLGASFFIGQIDYYRVATVLLILFKHRSNILNFR